MVLSNKNKYIESLCIEKIRKNQKNIVLSCIYRPPRRNRNVFTTKIKDVIERYNQKQQWHGLVGDSNLNSLD